MTGRGGWPLSVWLTPEGAPFYGGTYFPDRAPLRHALLPAGAAGPRGGMGRAPGGARGSGRTTRREHARLEPGHPRSRADRLPQAAILHGRTLKTLGSSFDPVHGGWGSAPKFPQPMLIESSSHAARRSSPTRRCGRRSTKTLDAMAAGGIYRPPGRRLPPLLHGRRMAGAPLREDALRQRPPGPLLPARLAALGEGALPAGMSRRLWTTCCAT